MIRYYNKTSVGYSHIRENKVCQDFSCSYQDGERTIVTVCDGHGGKIYFRSHLGSKFASDAIMKVFRKFGGPAAVKRNKDDMIGKLKLEILCEWNAMVEQDISKNPFSDEERSMLNEDELFRLKLSPALAYGTTLGGVMAYRGRLYCVLLGDGGMFVIKEGKLEAVFPESDDDPVANLTYSMCQENAYDHLKAEILGLDGLDGAVICTDGTINPYRNLKNFNDSFVTPVIGYLNAGDPRAVDDFMEKLGREIGIGDDVSLGLLLTDGNGRNGKDDEI